MSVLGWILLVPVLYYVSIFPVVITLNVFFGDLSHVPGPLITGISGFYYPWGLLADAFPLLGQPLDTLDRVMNL